MALLISGASAVSALADDRDVIINEIMYHPPNGLDNLQFVEVFNRGETAVDLSNWSFTKGIKFTFPVRARIGPGAYAVVCHSLTDFTGRYGKLTNVFGNFTGKLSHGGARIELSDSRQNVIDWVKYSDHVPWPIGPDGHSSSLERICPSAPSQDAENWASSKLPATQAPGGTPGRKNDNFSTNLPPSILNVEFKPPAPQQKVSVSAIVADADGVKGVTLLYRIVTAGRETPETPVPMNRMSGDEKKGRYEAAIDAQSPGALVRFRLKAVDATGAERIEPPAYEPRPTYSYSTLVNTNTAGIPFGFVMHVGQPERPAPNRMRAPAGFQTPALPGRGTSAFIYMPTGGGQVQTFDYVRITPRKGGFKVRFQRDRALNGMTTVNIIFESSPRWVLAEPLSYEVYRMAGVPAELTDHIRVWMDGRPMGYYLLIEQPNKSFLTRNGRNDSGNLYKLIWYGQGVIGQHEKKTNPTTGHDDLLKVIDGLNKKRGAEQWDFIQQTFNVEELINYFAVNMCIQNWDGFFNNFFTYHDTGKTGKWEMYPWDEDKTWGDYDGASPLYDWYEMPLTMGMNGDRSPSLDPGSKANNLGGPFGGVSWWRHPGYFSGPLLANPEFRKRFLVRLREICDTVFTEEKFLPVINTMEKRLEPEIRFRAAVTGENPQAALQRFRADMQSFRKQLQNRRKFILAELNKTKL